MTAAKKGISSLSPVSHSVPLPPTKVEFYSHTIRTGSDWFAPVDVTSDICRRERRQLATQSECQALLRDFGNSKALI